MHFDDFKHIIQVSLYKRVSIHQYTVLSESFVSLKALSGLLRAIQIQIFNATQ